MEMERITVYVTPEIKRVLEVLALANRRSLASQAGLLLEAAVENHQSDIESDHA